MIWTCSLSCVPPPLGVFHHFVFSLNISPWNFANWSFVPFVRILWCASNSKPYSFFTPPPSFSFFVSPSPFVPFKTLGVCVTWPRWPLLPLYFANGFHMWRTRHFAWKCSRLLVGPIKKKDHVHERMWSVSLFRACVLSVLFEHELLPLLAWLSPCVDVSLCTVCKYVANY